jgi:hypothetical protein
LETLAMVDACERPIPHLIPRSEGGLAVSIDAAAAWMLAFPDRNGIAMRSWHYVARDDASSSGFAVGVLRYRMGGAGITAATIAVG